MESLRELNQICQKPRYKETGNWMVRHILRDAALPITWLLLHTPVTANQVTLASLIIGLAGIMCFAVPSKFIFLIGALLLQCWYLLDHVDGQIARYRKTASLTGRFFDFMTHHIIHGVIFFSLSLYCFQVTGASYFMVWGFIASFSMTLFNLSHDTKYKTFFERLQQLPNLTIKIREQQKESAELTATKVSLRKLFSILHKMSEIHVFMNILTLTAVVQFAVGWFGDLRFLIFLIYGCIAPFLALTKITYLIIKREIDSEFVSNFNQ